MTALRADFDRPPVQPVLLVFDDGREDLTAEVSPEVAEVLTTPDREPREIALTDLSRPGEEEGFRPEYVPQPDKPPRPDPSLILRGGARPHFRLFLGLSIRWPVPRLPDGRCGCCRGLPLGDFTYCLLCDRSGSDRLIPRPGPSERPRRPASGPQGKRAALAGGRSKATPPDPSKAKHLETTPAAKRGYRHPRRSDRP